MAKKSGAPMAMPDLSGLVTWDRLEDALKGIRESLEKSSTDAAAALASAEKRDNRSAKQTVERPSQTVSAGSKTSNMNTIASILFVLFFCLCHLSQQNKRSVTIYA
jgi:hypothetical protein